MQPRWLVSQLEELDYQTDFQVELVTSLLFQTQQLHMTTQSFLELAKADVFVVLELYEGLVLSYEAAFDYAKTRNTRVDHQVEVAANSLTQSEKSLDDTRNLIVFWQNQEQQAREWLSSAYARLQRCITARKAAEASLLSAKNELSRAESALRHARNQPPRKVYRGTDKNGHALYDYERVSTYNEEVRVSNAHSSVNSCQSSVNSAVSAENSAQAEVSRAQVQVNGSQSAISDSKEAAVLAEQSCEVATHGKRESQYSKSSSQQCLETLEQIKVLLDRFKQTCEEQSDVVALLNNDSNEAFLHLRGLEGQQESMQDQAFSLKYTLQDKIGLLLSYDQPLTLAG